MISLTIQVKGTGKCGYYRLFGESTAEEDIKAKELKDKLKKEKEERLALKKETGEVISCILVDSVSFL